MPLEGGVTTDVAVRVWQDVRDERRVYISTLPEGGSWEVLGTLSLLLDDGTSTSGLYRYGDARMGVLAPRGEPSSASLYAHWPGAGVAPCSCLFERLRSQNTLVLSCLKPIFAV